MKLVEFKKTGNFWIDNGIVALYKMLLTLQPKLESELALSFSFELSNKSLTLKSSEEGVLLKVLNKAKRKAVENYLVETNKAGWIYTNDDFDTYRRTDFKMALKPFFTGKTPSTKGALCVPFDKAIVTKVLREYNVEFEEKKGTVILKDLKLSNGKDLSIPSMKEEDAGSKGNFMSAPQFIKFIKFLSEKSPVLIEGKEVKLEGKGFLNSKPQYEIGDDFSEDFLTEGKKKCFFSGESYKICEGISGMDYPFLTGSSGELNFASNLSGKPLISAKYAFVAMFSFYNLQYLLNGDFKNYFLLYDSNLQSLSFFYSTLETDASQLRNPTWCNFRNDMLNVEFESESLFAFMVSLYNQVKDELHYDDLYTKAVYTFTNDGNIFRDVKEYTLRCVDLAGQ
jgi:hypothetical protein